MSNEPEKPESRKPKTENGIPICGFPAASPSPASRSLLAAPTTEGQEGHKTSFIALPRIESVLRKEIGLDAASIGTSAIERTVRQRMKKLGLESTAEYARLLASFQAELDELIESVVVMETWFFRDCEPFRAFLRLALEKLEKSENKKQKTETGFLLSTFPVSAFPRER